MKDCVIIGGGPAGLTAALYLGRFLRTVTVFDAQEGRMQTIPETNNLGPFPGGISGLDLLHRMRSHAELYAAVVEIDTVLNIEKLDAAFRVTTELKTVSARNVVIATGVVNHPPPLSNEDHARGLLNGMIRYCPICDAYEVRGKRVAVLGGGAHGFEEARFVRDYTSRVTLIPTDGSTAIAGGGVEVLDSPLKSVALSDTHVMLTLDSGEIQRFDTVYVALGTTPRTELAAKLNVRMAEDGGFLVDSKQRTSAERLYAIGDVAAGLDQIAVAMGQAAVAATAIHNDLPSIRGHGDRH